MAAGPGRGDRPLHLPTAERRHVHKRTLPALGGALLTLTLLSACGHTPATTAAASTSSRQADAPNYAQCMRRHGGDVPDPQTSGGGAAIRIQRDPGSGINPAG